MARDTESRMYLVCEHKTNGRKLVPNGLSILDEEGLVMIISCNPDIKMVNKSIKPDSTSMDIYKIDLVPEEQKATLNTKAKIKAELEVPWKEFFGYEWEGHSFDEVMILVPESIVDKVVAESKEVSDKNW